MKLNLNTQIFLGALAGIFIGFVLQGIDSTSQFYQNSIYLFTLVGKLFIGLLKMILIPLVFTSIVVGLSQLSGHKSKHKVWQYTCLYFFCSSSIAIILGLWVVNLVKPGKGLNIDLLKGTQASLNVQKMDIAQFFDSFISGLFVNPITAMANMDVLPTIIFALLVGIALNTSDSKVKNLKNFFEELFCLMMRLVSWVMIVAPFGIMALLAKLIATQNIELLQSLGKFIFVVIGTTVFHGIVILPGLLWIITRISPIHFFTKMRESLLTAFATSSSSATMPITLRCVEENLKVDKSIAGFVVPMGTTLNMDGTALYEAVAAIFIANLIGIELNLVQQIIVFMTSMLASIGAPGIPSAGMVTLVMVLQSVGLPAEAIAILIPIDRPLDAIRTVVNVEGDAVGSLIVQKLVSNET